MLFFMGFYLRRVHARGVTVYLFFRGHRNDLMSGSSTYVCYLSHLRVAYLTEGASAGSNHPSLLISMGGGGNHTASIYGAIFFNFPLILKI